MANSDKCKRCGDEKHTNTCCGTVGKKKIFGNYLMNL
jgi:hypothetical protein